MFMGAALTWASKQQRTVAVSTAESEYTAVSDCAREAMWVRRLVADLLGLDKIPVTPLMEDNTAAGKWCYNPVNHGKQKHIDIAYHFVREQIAEFGTLTIVPVPTVDQLADLATKALPAPRFEYLVRKVFNIAADRSLRSTPLSELPTETPTPLHTHTPPLPETCRTKASALPSSTERKSPPVLMRIPDLAKSSCPPRDFLRLRPNVGIDCGLRAANSAI
jgi:hypothetical protein